MKLKVVRPQKRLRIVRTESWFWSAHTHSAYSAQDALPTVEQIVAKAAAMGQKAVGLTDHGNMAGSIELYRACKKAGIKPFPGSELYLVPDTDRYKKDYASKTTKASRFHLGVLATNLRGYENLVHLSSLSHQNHFHKPLVDFNMLATLADEGRTEGLVVTTGCFFGYAIQQLLTQGMAGLNQYLHTLESWFPGGTYVEIQNHNIDHGNDWTDEAIAEALVTAADNAGLPVIITQDSHYVEPHDKEEHDVLKRLVAFGPEPDDAVFPGDGFHLASDHWIEQHHRPEHLLRGREGLQHLYERGDLRIGVLDSYSYSVPLTVPDPEAVLRERCERVLVERGLGSEKYLTRLYEELGVISVAKMAGYLLLVAEVTDFMTREKFVFQTRGSAAGSLACWLLGITNVDPVKWGLMFERFLSKDRTKPPDIDLDIEHARRQELVDWLSTRYAVNQIGTWQEMSLTGDEETSKGALLVKYYSAHRKQTGENITWEAVPQEHRDQLIRLAGHKPFSGIGTNAAGFVITSTRRDFDTIVPVMYMADKDAPKKHRLLSQYDLGSIEALGLVKLDVLGIKTLTVLRKTLDLLGEDNLDWIPLNDKRTYHFIRQGKTDGVFQLEGGATARGVRDLKPTTINDVIAAMALFRPATMNSGATRTFINRKHRREEAPQRHEIIHRHTKATHGILLYQEQVIAVLRDLGMNADDLTKFLKAIKASNANIGDAGKVIAGMKELIHSLCEKVGMTHADKDWLDEAFAAYAGYGFNSAHATVYGLTAYRCAYLVVHHPVEFHTSLLAVAAGKKDKEVMYLRAAVSRGIKVLGADINISGDTYTIDTIRGAVRRGLQSVPGIGEVTAKELAKHQPYASLLDLCERVNHTKVTGVKGYRETQDLTELSGALEKLHTAGVLDSLV